MQHSSVMLSFYTPERYPTTLKIMLFAESDTLKIYRLFICTCFSANGLTFPATSFFCMKSEGTRVVAIFLIQLTLCDHNSETI